jgi:hypothetical protein
VLPTVGVLHPNRIEQFLLNWRSTSFFAALLNSLHDWSMMRTLLTLLLLMLISCIAVSQNSISQQPTTNISSAPAVPAVLATDLDRVQAAAAQTTSDIARMRIDKWKTDADSKKEEQSNANSLQRNLSSALPGLISSYRAEPQNLNTSFKLYRNLNALYDVLSSFTEAAGAFGPKNDYETLAQQLSVFDTARRDLGDNLESLTAQNQSELNQLRTQIHSLQQVAVPAPPAKPAVVDNDEPVKKPTKKKKASTTTAPPAKPASGTSSTPATTPASNPSK